MERKNFVIAAALAAFSWTAFTPEAANAVVIAGWNFESKTYWGTAASFAGTSFGTYVAEVGSGSMYGAKPSAPTNATWTVPAGNGTVASASAIGWSANNSYWEFEVSTALYKDIAIAFDQVSSSTGPKNWTLQYRIGAGGYNNFAAYNINYNSTGGTVSWSSTVVRTESKYSFDLSSITALNGQSSVFLRLLISGTQQYNPTATAPFGTAGSSRIDNIMISGTAVPEPGTAAVLAAGAAVAVARKRKRK